MAFNPSSCWNSIVDKLTPHIPSIDFDFSSPEKDEIVTVYQRPAGLSLTVPDDFDSFLEEDAELEELLKPVAQTRSSEQICSQLNGDYETVENSTAAQWCTQQAVADVEAGACERNFAVLKNEEVRLDASLKPNVQDTKSDEGFPVLSFARLDQCDLDDVLQNLKNDKLCLKQPASTEPVKTHADGDNNQSQGTIMERLVAFCKNQSVSVSEPVRSPNCMRQNNVWNKSLENITTELQLSHQERPTVYIDLRCPDPSIKPAAASPNLSSESESLDKRNTHQETPPAKKHNLKVHIGSQMLGREVTGKSMLLRKIKEMNRNRNKYPAKSTEYPEAEEMKDKPPQPAESACSHDLTYPWVKKQSSPVQSRKLNMKSPATVQERSVKKPKQQSDQQRCQVKQLFQREQDQNILKQLEKHCPTKSVFLRQPAAERTDVLYEFEASHQKSINTLPEDIESKGCMLLIVNLCSPGMVGEGTHGKRKHLCPAATKSHIYNTLVTWFLSLADPDPCHNEDEVSAKVPFWVAGLQQLWTEDGLALHVLAVARHTYSTRKRGIDIHAPFYHNVCKFLSETSLTIIANWLPELKNLLDQQYASPIHLPSSSLDLFVSACSNKKVIDRTFGISPGFYWQTVETQERGFKGREATQELHTEVSVVLGSSGFFQHPLITHYTLQLVLDSGLDVCGLRLLYPPQGLLSDCVGGVPVKQRAEQPCQAILALAVRGPYAYSFLKDLTSSLDPLLPKKADTTFVSPLHGRNQGPLLIHSPRLANQVHNQLCLWFSGRLQGGSAQNLNQHLNRVVPLDDRVKGSPAISNRSSSFLCATTKADLLLVVSPVVPPYCYGQALLVCERRGFSLRGLQRLQLQSNDATVLGLTNHQAAVFCSPPPTATLDQEKLKLPSHCLVLLLRKENVSRHSVSLPSALMREFKAKKLLGCIHSKHDSVHTTETNLCFHTALYNNNLLHTFVRCMSAVPDPSSVILCHQKCPSNLDTEQTVILTLCGKDMSQGLSLLHRVLIEGPEGDVQHAGLELLGLKWIPVLTRLQAQELSPYEVGEQLCYGSVDTLMSAPALVCALRGFEAFSSLRKLLPHNYPYSLSVLMSPTPEVALRQASLFFFEHEMIPDQQMLLTICLFKPRVWNHTLAKILNKLQQSGLMLVGLRVVTLDKSDASSLLPAENVLHLCSGCSLALCLQGQNAVKRLLDVLGQEDSSLWMTCYGSGSYQKAIKDVKRFFPEGLCCTETSTMRREQILSLCSDPLVSVERERSCTLAHVAQESLLNSVTSGPNRGSLIHRALWQTTCLLIPLNASPHSQVPSQLEMVEQLLRSGCHLVAGRMSILDNEQKKHIAKTLAVSSSGRDKMAHFYTAPCLIMAFQGEKIVAGFRLTLKSIYKERPDLEKVGEMMVYPESEEEAKQLICYLFDALSPEG